MFPARLEKEGSQPILADESFVTLTGQGFAGGQDVTLFFNLAPLPPKRGVAYRQKGKMVGREGGKEGVGGRRSRKTV